MSYGFLRRVFRRGDTDEPDKPDKPDKLDNDKQTTAKVAHMFVTQHLASQKAACTLEGYHACVMQARIDRGANQDGVKKYLTPDCQQYFKRCAEKREAAIAEFMNACNSHYEKYEYIAVTFIRKPDKYNFTDQVICPCILIGEELKTIDFYWAHTVYLCASDTGRDTRLCSDPPDEKFEYTGPFSHEKHLQMFIEYALKFLKLYKTNVLIRIEPPPNTASDPMGALVDKEEDRAALRQFVDAFQTFVTRIITLA